MAIRKLLYHLPLIVTVDTEAGEVLSVDEDGDHIDRVEGTDVWDEDWESVGTDSSEDPVIVRAYEIADESEWPARDSLM